ncbi:MAG: FecCD family ABC transporter permease [Anaerorhabdus sp.]
MHNKNQTSDIPKNFRKVMLIGLLLLCVVILLSIFIGSNLLPVQEVLDALVGTKENVYNVSLVDKRLARTCFALLCGASLGLSGALMQAVTRNPVADPSILGVNTGASLAVVFGIAFLGIQTQVEYIFLALIGAALTSLFVYGIGSLGSGGATPMKLILAGAATTAALSSMVSALLIPRSFVMDVFRFWQVGSVGSASWATVRLLIPFFFSGLMIALVSSPALNALALGDEAATGLGVKVNKIRFIAAAGGVLLCAAVTALAGPIGFIGLLAIHLMRLVLGPNLRITVPLSALSGAIILTFSDVIGRLLGSPGELEVGVVTAFIGAPILILITMRKKVKQL